MAEQAIPLTKHEMMSMIGRATHGDWRLIPRPSVGKIFLVIEEKTDHPIAYESPLLSGQTLDVEVSEFDTFLREVQEATTRKRRELKATTTRPDGLGLTAAEHKALELTAELGKLFALEIIHLGPSCRRDRDEAALHIHTLQRMIMAQAAARAHPELYRLLGTGGHEWLASAQ